MESNSSQNYLNPVPKTSLRVRSDLYPSISSNSPEGKLFVIGEALFQSFQLKTVTHEYPFPIKKMHRENLFTRAGIQEAYLLARADLKVTIVISVPKSLSIFSTFSIAQIFEKVKFLFCPLLDI